MAKEENKKNKNEFKNFKLELKKVVWPTPKQLANNTVAVVAIVLLTAAIVFGLDFVFEKANEYGIEKLKTSVESKKEDNNTNSEENLENSKENVEGNSTNEEESSNTQSENNTESTNQTENANSEGDQQ